MIENWSDRIVLVELQDDPAFTDDMNALLDQLESHGEIDAVLNFANVNYLNSSNIAKLLRIRKTLLSTNGKLKLCCVNTHVWGLFLVTGLDKVFSFHDDVSMALAACQLDRD